MRWTSSGVNFSRRAAMRRPGITDQPMLMPFTDEGSQCRKSPSAASGNQGAAACARDGARVDGREDSGTSRPAAAPSDHRIRTWRGGAVIAVGLMVALAGPLVAQSSSGTISGRVLDAQGHAVPGATVTLVKGDTHETRIFTTDHAGEFVFASI